MDADDFRDYILGFIFYEYLFEKMELYANHLLAEDNTTYVKLGEASDEDQKFMKSINEEANQRLHIYGAYPTQ